MSVKRREFLSGAVAAGAAVALPGTTWAGVGVGEDGQLIIGDSRIARVAPGRNGACSLDIARLSDTEWFALSAKYFEGIRRVDGITQWQDFVVLRDLFRDRGFRLTDPEQRIDTPAGRAAFAWRMARRS